VGKGGMRGKGKPTKKKEIYVSGAILRKEMGRRGEWFCLGQEGNSEGGEVVFSFEGRRVISNKGGKENWCM